MTSQAASGIPGRISRSFPCVEATVEDCRLTVHALLDPLGIDERALGRIDVVLEELVSNVVRHSRRASVILLAAAWAAGELELEISDDGEPFDPVAAPDPAPFTELEEARLGGLGIHLVRRLATTLDYARIAGAPRDRNRVRVTLPAPPIG